MSDVTITQSLFLLLGCFTGFIVGYAFGSPGKRYSKKGQVWDEDYGIWRDKT